MKDQAKELLRQIAIFKINNSGGSTGGRTEAPKSRGVVSVSPRAAAAPKAVTPKRESAKAMAGVGSSSGDEFEEF